jgi:hypothetical protein
MKIIQQIIAIIFCVTTLGCNGQTPTVTLSKTLTGHTEPINCLSY